MILLIIFPIIDLFLLNFQWQEKLIPNQSFFLVGNSEGHMMQILFLWFLPLYLLVMVGENYIQDVESGKNNILILKKGKKQYFKTSLLFSFTSTFIAVFLSLLINYILVCIINFNGTASPFDYSEQQLSQIKQFNPTLFFELSHPTITNFIFILISSLISGLLGAVVTSICFIFPKRVYTYFSSFILWFLLIMGNSSILLLYQPFTEYSLQHLLQILLQILIIFSGIIGGSYFYKVKTDEI